MLILKFQLFLADIEYVIIIYQPPRRTTTYGHSMYLQHTIAMMMSQLSRSKAPSKIPASRITISLLLHIIFSEYFITQETMGGAGKAPVILNTESIIKLTYAHAFDTRADDFAIDTDRAHILQSLLKSIIFITFTNICCYFA